MLIKFSLEKTQHLMRFIDPVCSEMAFRAIWITPAEQGVIMLGTNGFCMGMYNDKYATHENLDEKGYPFFYPKGFDKFNGGTIEVNDDSCSAKDYDGNKGKAINFASTVETLRELGEKGKKLYRPEPQCSFDSDKSKYVKGIRVQLNPAMLAAFLPVPWDKMNNDLLTAQEEIYFWTRKDVVDGSVLVTSTDENFFGLIMPQKSRPDKLKIPSWVK